MATPEISQGIKDYLAPMELSDRDRRLRGLRRLVEQAGRKDPAPDLNSLPEGLDPEVAAEGAWLVSLLQGYYLAAQYRHQDALSHFDRLIAGIPDQAASSLPQSYIRCRAQLGRGFSLTELGQNSLSLDEAKAMEPRLEPLNLPALAAEHEHLKGLAWRRLGESQGALVALRHALEACQGLDDELLLARIEDTLGLTYLDLGALDQAELYLQRSLARRARYDDQAGLALTLGNLSRYHAAQENFDLANQYLEGELAICNKLGTRKGCIVSLQEMARLAVRLRAWAQAEDYLNQAEPFLEASDSQICRGCQAFSWAYYYLAREMWPEAEKQYRQAMRLFGLDPGEFIEAQLEVQAAKLAATQGHWERAQLGFEDARQRFQLLNRPANLAQLEFDWGMGLIREKRLDQAVDHIAQAILGARDLQVEPMVRRFTESCQQIGVKHWLQALIDNKKLSRALKTEKAHFEKLAEEARGIIHDLKNKVIPVNVYLHKVKEKVQSLLEPKLAKSLGHAITLGLYMEQWLMSVLNGLKTGEGLFEVPVKPIPLSPVIQKLGEIFALQAPTGNKSG